MERRALGSIADSISAIGQGCALFSEGYGPPNDVDSLDLLHAAFDAGINFFDTSDAYGLGHNEQLLGKFLRGRREQVVVATKVGLVRKPGDPRPIIDNSPRHISAACEASLQRLGIETIDLYYLQRRDPAVPIEEVVGAMARLVKKGMVRHVGLSEVSADTVRLASRVHPIAALQSEYSLWSRGPESGVLDACRALSVTFVAYCPLGRAFLTGQVRSLEGLDPNDFRRRMPRFQPGAFEKNQGLIPALEAFAADHHATCGQIALSWLLCKSPHIVPIPGTRQRQHLMQNVAAATIRLSTSEIQELDALFSPSAVAGSRLPPPAMAGIEEAL